MKPPPEDPLLALERLSRAFGMALAHHPEGNP